ncbi:Alkaline_phosphatase [Hexamita inflata]|uniref:Alkaline phosphatase n=2 Tax=Hexamita inflata TaxID=28002 RepID=A0AA86U7U1_9EUKA|nr:Alkaline phosphatase [Hexamita inflata]CAI9941022.1 Alkaline phosphatase [Hexamita inflata]CAI9967535.1 Alkaline phosphatase [Hexamita inflata]CAI9967537.1 Alkaline phosphatase [Hexamita inflata]
MQNNDTIIVPASASDAVVESQIVQSHKTNKLQLCSFCFLFITSLAFMLYYISTAALNFCAYVIYFNSFQFYGFAYLSTLLILLPILSVQLYKFLKHRKIPTVKFQFFQLALIIVFIVDAILFQEQFKNVSYGPLTILNGNQTHVHWYTSKKSNTILRTNEIVTNITHFSRFHNVFVNSSKFEYQIEGHGFNSSSVQNFKMNDQVKMFSVMTDIHSNNRYLSQAPTYADFMILGGDYSNGGRGHEFAKSFKGAPNIPYLMAVGNHDVLGNSKDLVLRHENFYQKVHNVGIYVLFVLKDGLISGQYVNKTRADAAIKFLEQRIEKNHDEHVFIVVHNPVYSTGNYGSSKYFTTIMEKFLDEHSRNNIRAIFTGHDHLFAAFKRNHQYIFVSGGGGGDITNMRSILQGKRAWETKTLKGPLQILNDNCLGYEHHLDSELMMTRTDVTFEPHKIKYSVVNADSQKVVHVYEQEF